MAHHRPIRHPGPALALLGMALLPALTTAEPNPRGCAAAAATPAPLRAWPDGAAATPAAAMLARARRSALPPADAPADVPAPATGADDADTGGLLSAAALQERILRYRAPLATRAAAGQALAGACRGDAGPAAG